eukprot:TRINITY_DN10464_c0_g1_i1.p1 TRINITY_DN10464_c0_g1~~TRINITY_DN10464_c0_g1_i1.p1  ORF type:complete len:262 (-),score=-16.00 TRINITY_DN10464_c0_g1_i1:283-1068(-)
MASVSFTAQCAARAPSRALNTAPAAAKARCSQTVSFGPFRQISLLGASQSATFAAASSQRRSTALRTRVVVSASAEAVAPTASSSPPPSPAAVLVAVVAAASAAAAAVARAVTEPLRALFAPLSPAEQRSLDALTGKAAGAWGAARKLVAMSAPLLCFAAIGQSGSASSGTSTPLTVVASGMAKWLELYSGLLLVRVLLSWFPNIDWERQPMQAIRDMSDPYLNLFRNILPPFFGALDLSPMLAFLVLGMLTSLLNTTVFT